MTKSTKRQFLVSVKGISGRWRTSSGGEVSAEVTKDYDGGAQLPDLLGGAPTASDLEITRTFDPVRDMPILRSLRTKVGRTWYTITKQATDANFGGVRGGVITYRGLLISVSDPDSDAGSSDVAEFTLKFATNGGK